MALPADAIGNAIIIAEIATGEIEDITTNDGKNTAAVALGRMGGRARAEGMTPSAARRLPRRRLLAGGEKVGLLGRRKSLLSRLVHNPIPNPAHDDVWLHRGVSETKSVSSRLSRSIKYFAALSSKIAKRVLKIRDFNRAPQDVRQRVADSPWCEKPRVVNLCQCASR